MSPQIKILGSLISLTLISLTPKTSFAQSPQCRLILDDTPGLIEAPTLSPLENTMAQLEARLIRADNLLVMATAQTQRQSIKMMKQLKTLVENFTRDGDISDSNLNKLVELGTKLEKLEASLIELELARLTDPFDLKRYLHVADPIKEGIEYHADLPSLGHLKVTFSKEVADIFAPESVYRQVFFPVAFRGIVAKKGQSGIKELTGKNLRKIVNDVEYRVLELKKVGGFSPRVLIIYGSDNSLYFYRFISNHNRIDYLSKEKFLENFIKHHLKKS